MKLSPIFTQEFASPLLFFGGTDIHILSGDIHTTQLKRHSKGKDILEGLA